MDGVVRGTLFKIPILGILGTLLLRDSKKNIFKVIEGERND